MTVTTKPVKPLVKISFVPWDPSCPAHFKRMVDQRIACGWQADFVGQWKQEQENGDRVLYWIVLDEDHPDREKLVASHVSKFPDESAPLNDTTTHILSTPHKPTGLAFNPVGHIAIASLTDTSDKYREGCWIQTFYISAALQSTGLGGAAMRKAEALIAAADGPFRGEASYLTTVPETFQFAEENRRFYEQLPPISNETWYKRQGYKVYKSDPRGHIEKTKEGETLYIPLLFFRKPLITAA